MNMPLILVLATAPERPEPMHLGMAGVVLSTLAFLQFMAVYLRATRRGLPLARGLSASRWAVISILSLINFAGFLMLVFPHMEMKAAAWELIVTGALASGAGCWFFLIVTQYPPQANTNLLMPWAIVLLSCAAAVLWSVALFG